MESTDTAKWNLNNLNHFTSQTTWLDLAESNAQAVQVDCTGTTGTCYAQYLWQTKALYPLRGKFVNVRLRMLAPSSLNASQTVQVQFLLGSGANPTTTIAHSDSWQTVTLSAWVPSTESALYLRIVPDTINTYTGSVYVSDVCVTEGVNPPIGLVPSRNTLINSLALGFYGLQSVAFTSSDVTLTGLNLFATELELTGGDGSVHNLIFPATVGGTGNQTGLFKWINNKSSSAITVKQTGQTGFTVGVGARVLAYYNGTDMQRMTMDVLGDGFALVATQSASGSTYTVSTTGGAYIASSYTPNGAQTITLPASPQTGEVHYIIDEGGAAASHNITIAGNGKTINGTTTISVNFGHVTLRYNGVAWFVIG